MIQSVKYRSARPSSSKRSSSLRSPLSSWSRRRVHSDVLLQFSDALEAPEIGFVECQARQAAVADLNKSLECSECPAGNSPFTERQKLLEVGEIGGMYSICETRSHTNCHRARRPSPRYRKSPAPRQRETWYLRSSEET